MKVKYLMERAGIQETGRGMAYLKDALEELNVMSETHVETSKINIVKDQRFYSLPSSLIQLKGVRCKNHLNNKDEYRGVPRLIYEPLVVDEDNK